MRTKANASTNLPILRGLGESEAAIYLSLSVSFFRDLVKRGVMPPPRLIGKRRVWDVEELDVAFRALPPETSGLAPDQSGFGTGSWTDYE
jgi:hypothetical protein